MARKLQNLPKRRRNGMKTSGGPWIGFRHVTNRFKEWRVVGGRAATRGGRENSRERGTLIFDVILNERGRGVYIALGCLG